LLLLSIFHFAWFPEEHDKNCALAIDLSKTHGMLRRKKSKQSTSITIQNGCPGKIKIVQICKIAGQRFNHISRNHFRKVKAINTAIHLFQ